MRLGDLDLSTEGDDASPQDFGVVRAISHPDYNAPAKYHDIALLELDREANFTEYVSPACLDTGLELNKASLIATGWGKTGFSEGSSTSLLKVNLDHVPHRKCVQSFGKQSARDLPYGIVGDVQICAGTVKGKDTCQVNVIHYSSSSSSFCAPLYCTVKGLSLRVQMSTTALNTLTHTMAPIVNYSARHYWRYVCDNLTKVRL